MVFIGPTLDGPPEKLTLAPFLKQIFKKCDFFHVSC